MPQEESCGVPPIVGMNGATWRSNLQRIGAQTPTPVQDDNENDGGDVDAPRGVAVVNAPRYPPMPTFEA